MFEFVDNLQKALGLFLRAEAHDALDACAVVPTAIEDGDFAPRGEVRDIALKVHLSLLALGRRRQCDDVKDPRADALRDRLDSAPLAGAIASFEHYARFSTRVDDPLLQ